MIGAKTARIGNPHCIEYGGLPESKCAGASDTSCISATKNEAVSSPETAKIIFDIYFEEKCCNIKHFPRFPPPNVGKHLIK